MKPETGDGGRAHPLLWTQQSLASATKVGTHQLGRLPDNLGVFSFALSLRWRGGTAFEREIKPSPNSGHRNLLSRSSIHHR